MLNSEDSVWIEVIHRLPGQVLDLTDFSFFGHNRAPLQINARNDSGGVCLFVKNDLLTLFAASVLNNSYDRILLISFKHKSFGDCFNICVIYRHMAHHDMEMLRNFMINYYM